MTQPCPRITKALIESVCRSSFSHSSIRKVEEDEWGVCGRWCIAHYLPQHGAWDVWVCNTLDMYSGIGTRRLNNLLRAVENIKTPTPGPLRVLDGEAIYLRMPTEAFLQAAPLLGIKQRRKPPPHAFSKAFRR